MTSSARADTRPEPAPAFARRVSTPPRQIVGVALLMVLPALALGGWLGDRVAVADAMVEAGLRVRVESPACARYGNLRRMRIRVDGTPADAGAVVRIEVDEEYLARFGEVETRPAETGAEGGRLVLEQKLDAEGRAGPWVLDLTPERHGWARGSVRVIRDDRASATLALATFVLP